MVAYNPALAAERVVVAEVRDHALDVLATVDIVVVAREHDAVSTYVTLDSRDFLAKTVGIPVLPVDMHVIVGYELTEADGKAVDAVGELDARKVEVYLVERSRLVQERPDARLDVLDARRPGGYACNDFGHDMSP